MCYLHIAAMHSEYLKASGQSLVNPLSAANLQGTSFKASSLTSTAVANTNSPSNVYLKSQQKQPNATAVSNFANSLIPTGKALFREITVNIEVGERAILEEKGVAQDDSFSQV